MRYNIVISRVILYFCCALSLVKMAHSLEHPHLFFNASDIDALKTRALAAEYDSDNFYYNPYQEIMIDCRSSHGPSLSIPESDRKRNAEGLLSHAALLLLDPEDRAVRDNYQSDIRFFEYYDAVLNWDDWGDFFNNTPFDTSLFLTALCIGYDLHYDKFSSSQRADIVNKLASRADYLVNHSDTFFEIPADLEDPVYYYLNTFKVLRNRHMIPVGALGMIAYTLEGEVDESRRQQWLNKVDQLMAIWDERVAHDGMSHEGYSYHEYLVQSLFPYLAVRSRKTGENQFTKYEYIHKHALYSIYSFVPGGDRSFIQPVPFGDCVTEPPADVRSLDALYASNIKGDPNHLDQLANWMQFRYGDGIPNNSYSRVAPMHFFWADDSIEMKSPSDLDLPLFHYYPERGSFVWRSGWDDMATYFAMICGPTIGGHQQPESGNFVIFKGGAPYIAHHGPTKKRRTEHHNVPMVNGQGQHGDRYEDGQGTTEPLPASQWASIEQVIGDNQYFNVFSDLKPVYREGNLSTLTREYIGVHGCIFVRDKFKMNDGNDGDYQEILHAYGTEHPNKPASESTALDIDSDRNRNPWSGSGRDYTVTPRDSGPYTSSLVVKDLSNENWSSSVEVANVNNLDDQQVNRGYKLLRSRTDGSSSSLTGFVFPETNVTVESWIDPAQAEGFILKENGNIIALTLWGDAGGVADGNNFSMVGYMGGLHLTDLAFWGRDVTSLRYNGTEYINAASPVTFYAEAGNEELNHFRYVSAAQVSVTIVHPEPVNSLVLNGVPVSISDWSWNNGKLTMSLPSSSSASFLQIQVQTGPPTQDIIDHILGKTPSTPEMDVNNDSVIDIGDVIKNTN